MSKEKKEASKKVEQSMKKKKNFSGVVTSDKMNKTIVVKIIQMKMHPTYNKIYTTSKKYKVHDEKNKFKEGDKVVFEECRPISKDKKWRVLYN